MRHNTPQPLPSSSLRLELEDLHPRCFKQPRGVEDQEESEEESGGSAGFVGTLLHLYLDGCLFGCKCSRIYYLELKFNCKSFPLPFIELSVCLEQHLILA